MGLRVGCRGGAEVGRWWVDRQMLGLLVEDPENQVENFASQGYDYAQAVSPTRTPWVRFISHCVLSTQAR